jgi:isopenicillin N synthase-like dioxygenase|tara:strand:+ start:389 stop:1303 length:915 start_codon:yes stop_codon:yes gene_type:complete
MLNQIPKINFKLLSNENHIDYQREIDTLKKAVTDYGFLIIKNYPIDFKEINNVFDLYRNFFNQSLDEKDTVNMSKTSSNRGWGGIKAERVNTDFNPDNKEIFDCGPDIRVNHEFQELPYYSKNIWPENIPMFETKIMEFYKSCSQISISILKQIEISLNYSSNYFADKFELPMALLRCNYYPKRSKDMSKKDFGIAPHTDYGCLTLLFTDGTPGLEVELPNKKWEKVIANKDEIIVNFGDMLEIWSKKQIKATPHRVIGGNKERFSIPFFFNPQYDTVISEDENILAGEYLSQRYDSTYVHKII